MMLLQQHEVHQQLNGTVESGLNTALGSAQDAAEAAARSAYQQAEWDKVESGLDTALGFAQDDAEAAARSAYQQAVWDALVPNLPADRVTAQDNAVSAAKIDTDTPVSYLGDIQQTVLPEKGFYLPIRVSGISDEITSAGIDIELNLPEGLIDEDISAPGGSMIVNGGTISLLTMEMPLLQTGDLINLHY